MLLKEAVEESILRCLPFQTDFSPWYSQQSQSKSGVSTGEGVKVSFSEATAYRVSYSPSSEVAEDVSGAQRKNRFCLVSVNHKRSLADGEKFCLFDLFFCEYCSQILSNNPLDIVQEIDSYYCPYSLENLSSQEAMKCSNRSMRYVIIHERLFLEHCFIPFP